MTFTSDTTISSDATIGPGETWTVNSGVTLTIASGVTITNQGTIDNSGTIINSGTINNGGTISNKCGGTFNNTGTINGNPVNNEPCSYKLTLFEDSEESDVFDLGQEARAVAETDDQDVTLVTFSWIDPSGTVDQTSPVPVDEGSANDTFTPDEVGTWTVQADFGNGVVIVETLDINFMVIPESAVRTIALVGSSLAGLGAFLWVRKNKSLGRNPIGNDLGI